MFLFFVENILMLLIYLKTVLYVTFQKKVLLFNRDREKLVISDVTLFLCMSVKSRVLKEKRIINKRKENFCF